MTGKTRQVSKEIRESPNFFSSPQQQKQKILHIVFYKENESEQNEENVFVAPFTS